MSDELALVNQVELRLLMTKSDEAFAQKIGVYLAPLLLKLKSPREDVRTKTAEVVEHVSGRHLTSRCQLPIDALLKQFVEVANDPSEYTNGLRYKDLELVAQALRTNTVDKEQFGQLIPKVIECLGSTKEAAQQQYLMAILLELVKHWNAPSTHSKEYVALREVFGLESNEGVEELLSDTCVALLNYTSMADQERLVRPTFKSKQFNSINDQATISLNGSCCTEEKPSILEFQCKKAAVKLVRSGAFSEQAMYFPLLVASHDGHSAVNEKAKEDFKRLRFDFVAAPELLAKLDDLITIRPASPARSAHAMEIVNRQGLESKIKYNDAIDASLGSTDPGFIMAGHDLIRSLLRSGEGTLSTGSIDTITSKIRERINNLGWPKLHSPSKKLITERESSYRIFGTLLSNVLNDERVGLLNFLFDALERDITMTDSTQDALFEVLPYIHNLSAVHKNSIKQTLFKMLLEPDYTQGCKYVAIRYASRIAPFSDAEARALCLLGLVSDNRSNVIDEARRGLHPHWHSLMNSDVYEVKATNEISTPFPKFTEMLNVLLTVDSSLKEKRLGKTWIDYSASSFTAAMELLEQVLAMEAAVDVGNKTILVVDESWKSRLETAVTMDKGVRDAVRQYLAKKAVDSGYSEGLSTYLKFTFQGMCQMNSKPVNDIWIRLLSQLPATIVEAQADTSNKLVELLDSTHLHIRETAAHGLGIIGTSNAVSDEEIKQLVVSMASQCDLTDRSSFDAVHGRILALGYVISRLATRGRLDENPAAVDKILQFVQSKDVAVRDAAIDAVFQLAMSKVVEPVQELVDTLQGLVKRDSERAVLALSALGMCDESERQVYLDKIMQVYDTKHTEFMFASGEAVVIAASGWDSTVTDRFVDVQGSPPPATGNNILEYALEQVLQSCKSSKPKLRKCACLWLLSVTQYCGHLPQVRQSLEKIHTSFMKFLTMGDDIIQESASRGLGIIYEMGDENLKSDLVRGLVQSFTTEKKNINAGAVSDDTELFAPGVLDTGDGSVSTYKDILNLASEVGDPSLVYKFMSLAAHSSLWASRRGAAFGLGAVLSKSNLDAVFESNDKLAKSLIPKLYRYRFDPNSGVRESMRGIWDTLITDKTAAIDNNYGTILSEMLKSMGDREWRVREASANALGDLLQGKPVSRYQDRLEEVWRMAFRALDDIKESVRNAGMQLTRSLTTTMVRHVDVDSGASEKLASKILAEMIPFLIGNNGLQSDAEEVSAFALDTLLKLCKQGGRVLKPYIPMLIEELLGLMSTLEPQAMNYLAMNADKYGLTSDTIDASRMQQLRNSPIMDAVEQMIELVDFELMKEFVPRLEKTIKKSVGLPSKLGSSRVVVMLVIRHLHQTAPYADSLLKACQSQLTNINDSVSQSFAMSAGYLCRIASYQAQVNYEKQVIEPLYFDGESERQRLIAAHAAINVAKYASDQFDAVASAFLPLIFVAKHDNDKQVKEKFDQAWNDNTGGTGAIKLHLKEIADLCSGQLNSQRWNMRQVAAQSVADASTVIDIDTTDFLEDLFDVLVTACKGKSWSGKELVLGALVKLATRAKSQVLAGELYNKIKSVIVTEAKRRNREYQAKALVSVGEFISAFPDSELYDVLLGQVEPHVLAEGDDDDDDDGVDEDGDVRIGTSTEMIAKEEARNEILKSAVESYRRVDIHDKPVSGDVVGKLCSLLQRTLQNEDSSKVKVAVTWRTKLAVLNAVSQFAQEIDDGAMVEPVWREIVERCGKDRNHERVRVETVRLGGVLDKFESLNVKRDLESLKQEEMSNVVLTELNKVL